MDKRKKEIKKKEKVAEGEGEENEEMEYLLSRLLEEAGEISFIYSAT